MLGHGIFIVTASNINFDMGSIEHVSECKVFWAVVLFRNFYPTSININGNGAYLFCMSKEVK
jgi:hypothetical protein